MANNVDKVQKLLRTLAPGATLEPLGGADRPLFALTVNHSDVPIFLYVDQAYLILQLEFGVLPKTNIAPLYRRLLEINSRAWGYALGITASNLLVARVVWPIDALDQARLLERLNFMVLVNNTALVPLAQEFQIPSTAT